VREAIAVVRFDHQPVEESLEVVVEVSRIVGGGLGEQVAERHPGRARFLELLIGERAEYLEPRLVREEGERRFDSGPRHSCVHSLHPAVTVTGIYTVRRPTATGY
jgi:hypothetical protein